MVYLHGRKWRAQWYENGKRSYKFFINKQDAIKCENENRAKNKERKQIARIYETTTQKNKLRCNAYVPK